MNEHTCKRPTTCCCDITALEPDEQCPVHGHEWPPKCGICGKFMKWPKYEEELEETVPSAHPMILPDDFQHKSLERIVRKKTGAITLGEAGKVFNQIYVGRPKTTAAERMKPRVWNNWQFFVAGIELAQKGRLTSRNVENLRRFFQ